MSDYDDWTEVAPGYWRRDEPIDEQAATALMRDRLAARGYELSPRRSGVLARMRRWFR